MLYFFKKLFSIVLSIVISHSVVASENYNESDQHSSRSQFSHLLRLPDEIITEIILQVSTFKMVSDKEQQEIPKAPLGRLASTCKKLSSLSFSSRIDRKAFLKIKPNFNEVDAFIKRVNQDNAFYLKGLRYLKISDINDNDLSSILSLLPNLISIDLRGNRKLSDNCFQSILNTPHYLKKINLWNVVNINGVSLNNLVQKFPNLKILNLQGTLVQDEHIVMLSQATSLEKLNLAACSRLTEHAIQNIINIPNLNALNISRNPESITDDALQTLATKTSLTQLQLESCIRLSDKGIGQLKKMNNIIILNLQGCKISKLGIEKFITELPKLAYLNIDMTNISSQQANRFRELFPKVVIEHIEESTTND